MELKNARIVGLQALGFSDEFIAKRKKSIRRGFLALAEPPNLQWLNGEWELSGVCECQHKEIMSYGIAKYAHMNTPEGLKEFMRSMKKSSRHKK